MDIPETEVQKLKDLPLERMVLRIAPRGAGRGLQLDKDDMLILAALIRTKLPHADSSAADASAPLRLLATWAETTAEAMK
jgi:hypothetical protein